MFISNDCPSFHLWWKKNLVKHWKVSKYYETDYLENFLLLFMFLLTSKFVRNSHIEVRIFFIFLKNILKQTSNSFNTKFQPPWKDWKSSYKVNFRTFLPLSCSNFRLKQCERPPGRIAPIWKWLTREIGILLFNSNFTLLELFFCWGTGTGGSLASVSF